MSVPKLSNYDSYISQLNAITDPQKKFEKFDEITSTELNSVSFQVLIDVGQNSKLYEACTSPTFTLGILGPRYIETILKATELCKKLSEGMMSSLSGSEKNRLWSACPQIDTYIDSKIYLALSRIIHAKNFAKNSSNPQCLLYPIHQEMWKFQENNHGSVCGCYSHIQTRFLFNLERPSEGLKTV